jgi:hypothetical protein
MICLACEKRTDRLQRLICTKCKGCFHFPCVNITSATFRESQAKLKAEWKCSSCQPNRYRGQNVTVSASSEITERTPEDADTTRDTDISSVLGDTNIMHTPSPHTTDTSNTDSISFDRFSFLIKKEFEVMKEGLTQSIIENIKQALIMEFNKKIDSLKDDMFRSTSTLSKEQARVQLKLNDTNENIKKLELENLRLCKELEALSKQIEDKQHTTVNFENYKKTIVLYGLDEYPGENWDVLLDRVTDVFYGILGINVNGFIEDLKRIGKRGYRRPIQVELISRRMKNYILNNKHIFMNTGLAVSEFMNTKELEKRQTLRNTLKCARKNDLHPIVKHDKVYVNGHEYTLPPNPEQPRRSAPDSPQLNVCPISTNSLDISSSQQIGDCSGSNFRQ